MAKKSKKRNNYKRTKALVKEKAGLNAYINRQTSDKKRRAALKQEVARANYKTINVVGEGVNEQLRGNYLVAGERFFNEPADNMRKWATIKRYHELLEDGKIKPNHAGYGYLDDYYYMEQQLTAADMEELTDLALSQAKVREERINRETKEFVENWNRAFEEAFADLDLD